MTTFVSVGNATQPFDRLLNEVAAITDRLPPPIIVQRGASRISRESWQVYDYMEMGVFEAIVRDADLLIMHGGAGSIIHAVSCGKRPVVMPRRAKYAELVDDHQLQFVLELQREGYVLLAKEPEDLSGAVKLALAVSKASPSHDRPSLVDELSRLLNEWAAGTTRAS